MVLQPHRCRRVQQGLAQHLFTNQFLLRSETSTGLLLGIHPVAPIECLQLLMTVNLRTEQNGAVAVTFAFHDTKFLLSTNLRNLNIVFLLAY